MLLRNILIMLITTSGACELTVTVPDTECIYCGKGTIKFFQIVSIEVFQLHGASAPKQNKCLHSAANDWACEWF